MELKKGEYFHSIKHGSEFIAFSDALNGNFGVAECTKNGDSAYVIGQKVNISGGVFDDFYTKGRHPDNLPKEPEKPTAELQKMLAKDAIEKGLQKGDKVWVQMEVVDASDCLVLKQDGLKDFPFYYNKETTEILFEPKPYTPKHGEDCRFEDLEGNICDCKAVEIKGKLYAYYEAEWGGTKIYYPHEFKQFLPL